MIAMRKLAELEISAASGLVREGPLVYVVADDEHFLDCYVIATGERRARIALPFAGELPEEHASRKHHKPDLESLAMLPDGRLLAIGSGSTPRRDKAVVLSLPRATEAVPTNAGLVELAPLYSALRTQFKELNIEGATAAGDFLRLLQRGNSAHGENAIVDLDLAATLRALDARAPLTDALLVAVHRISLGALDGVPLGFTDGCSLDANSARIAFAAAAEDTDNPYEDGACAGSVVGVLDESGRIERVERLEGRHKVEGLATAPGRELLLVVDPDDRSQRAPLFVSEPLF